MDRSEIIHLIREDITTDAYGVQRTTEKRRKIYAQVTSVTASEWFEGGRNGLNPQYRFVIFKFEYHGEEIVEYKGSRYTVYRTYEARDDALELYTEKRQGNVRSH